MGLAVHPSVRTVEVGKAFELEASLEPELDLDGGDQRVPDPRDTRARQHVPEEGGGKAS